MIDYVQFCGSGAHDKDEGINILTKDQRISAKELKDKIENGKDKENDFVLVDVRLDTEFEIGAIPGRLSYYLEYNLITYKNI